MQAYSSLSLATEVLDILPNPVLVKNEKLEYVWINAAFEKLFNVSRDDVIGKLDAQLFPDRQVSQCNGGDIRVLDNGEVDEAVETVFETSGAERETITRKSRLELDTGEIYLVGVMHDITDITRANAALKESESMLQEQAQKLSVLATTDMLTECGNRRALMEVAEQTVENQFSSAALLLMYLDKFKNINDRFGHDAGDAALQHFSTEIKGQLSSPEKLFRLGGEEFVVLLDADSAKEAFAKADELRTHIENSTFFHDTQHIPFTVSVGLVFKEKGVSSNVNGILSKADECLYQAKNEGRNRVKLAA